MKFRFIRSIQRWFVIIMQLLVENCDYVEMITPKRNPRRHIKTALKRMVQRT